MFYSVKNSDEITPKNNAAAKDIAQACQPEDNGGISVSTKAQQPPQM
jgi:hypothetical protein